MSDTWSDRVDELEPTGSDTDGIDELRPVDATDTPTRRTAVDDIEVDPVDAWEQAQSVGATWTIATADLRRGRQGPADDERTGLLEGSLPLTDPEHDVRPETLR